MENRTYTQALKEFAAEETKARATRDKAIQAAEERYKVDCENARRIEQRKIRMSGIALSQALKDLLLAQVTHLFPKEPGPYYPIKALLSRSEGKLVARVRPEYEAHLAAIDLVAALKNLSDLLSEDTASPLMRLGNQTAIELPSPPQAPRKTFSADIFHDLPQDVDAPFEITALRAMGDFVNDAVFFHLAIYAESRLHVPVGYLQPSALQKAYQEYKSGTRRFR